MWEECSEWSTREQGFPPPSRVLEHHGQEGRDSAGSPGRSGAGARMLGRKGDPGTGGVWAVGEVWRGEEKVGVWMLPIPNVPTGGQQSPADRARSREAAAGRETCGMGGEGVRMESGEGEQG